MKVCFPVEKVEGMSSRVYGHFGSAPFFVIVDTSDNTTSSVSNADQHHAHGACNPIKALSGGSVDAIVVGGIGRGALSRLNGMGVRVYQASEGTIDENLGLFLSSRLPEYALSSCCGGHSKGGGCAH